MAKVYFGHPIEKEMVSVVNLKPGEDATFLHLQVYFINLNKKGFELYPKKDPKLPEAPFLTGISETCRWSIDTEYFNSAVQNADYVVLAICNDGEYSGIKAFALGYFDPKYPKGIYISLVCNSSIGYDEDGQFYTLNLRVGQLLRLTLLNYANSIGITHAYNHASNLHNTAFHGRNGWKPQSTLCGESDPIADAFPRDYADMENYMKQMENEGKIKKEFHGYPMKLCSYNFNEMFREILLHTLDVMDKYKGKDLNNLCNFA